MAHRPSALRLSNRRIMFCFVATGSWRKRVANDMNRETNGIVSPVAAVWYHESYVVPFFVQTTLRVLIMSTQCDCIVLLLCSHAALVRR